MNRFYWNSFLVVAIGAGFYLYANLIFTKVTDPFYGSLAILLGCLFAAGISWELFSYGESAGKKQQI